MKWIYKLKDFLLFNDYQNDKISTSRKITAILGFLPLTFYCSIVIGIIRHGKFYILLPYFLIIIFTFLYLNRTRINYHFFYSLIIGLCSIFFITALFGFFLLFIFFSMYAFAMITEVLTHLPIFTVSENLINFFYNHLHVFLTVAFYLQLYVLLKSLYQNLIVNKDDINLPIK